MSLLLFSTDLMTASRVEGAAARAGVEFLSTVGIDHAAAQTGSGDVTLVLVDLTSASLDVAQLVERIRSVGTDGAAIVAFGPHVQKERLAAAREAGCDEVLTRGQFFAELDAIVQRTG